MNAFVILSVLVASCYAGYDKKQVGGPFPPYPFPGGQKPGTCPSISEPGSLGNSCFNDFECPGHQKCCYVQYSLARRCQVPQEFQRPGRCPNYYYGQQFGTGYCNTDLQCPYGYKCCTGANGDVNTCRSAQYGIYPGVGGPYPGVGGPYPGVGGPYPGVGGPYPGVGGPYPGVGGPYPGVGGPYPGVGGPYPGVGGVYPGVGGVYPGVHKKKVY